MGECKESLTNFFMIFLVSTILLYLLYKTVMKWIKVEHYLFKLSTIVKGIIQFDLDILLILLFFSASADFLSKLSGQGRHCCCPATGTVGGLEFQVDDLPDYKRLDM